MCILIRASVVHRAKWKHSKTLLTSLSFEPFEGTGGFTIQSALVRFINSGRKVWGSIRLSENKRNFTLRYLTDAATETKLRESLEGYTLSRLATLKFGFFLEGESTTLIWTVSNGQELIEYTLGGSITSLRQNGWPIRAAVMNMRDLLVDETRQDVYDRIGILQG